MSQTMWMFLKLRNNYKFNDYLINIVIIVKHWLKKSSWTAFDYNEIFEKYENIKNWIKNVCNSKNSPM